MTVPGDLDLRDQDGKSAFHLAVAQGNEEIVRSLIEKGANSMAKVGDQTPVEPVAMAW
jgi:ankyrin repeat protein